MLQSVDKVDIAIVGGGPAGLATAIAARREGLSVAVFDSRKPPIDKPCGEGLMPDGLQALAELGVEVRPEHGFRFRGIRFTNGATRVQADFHHGQALGIRRTVLHSLLCQCAERVGVHLCWGTPVTEIGKGILYSASGELACRWIAGADGHSSSVRRWAGLQRCSRERHRYAFRTHYAVAPWSDHMELHWAPDCQIYITPVAVDEVCVVVMSANRELRVIEALQKLPELHARLATACVSSVERGAVTSTRKLTRIYTDNVALVGDASGSVDAITGEGLCLSFQHATALAQAIRRGRIEDYAQQHRALARRPTLMADFMLLLANRPRLRESAVDALARRPRIFETMLAMHLGAASIPIFASSVIELGWQMLLG